MRCLTLALAILATSAGCNGVTWTYDPATGYLTLEGGDRLVTIEEDTYLRDHISPVSAAPNPGLSNSKVRRVYDLTGEANVLLCTGQIEQSHSVNLQARAILGEHLHSVASDTSGDTFDPSDVVATPDSPEVQAVIDRKDDAMEELNGFGME